MKDKKQMPIRISLLVSLIIFMVSWKFGAVALQWILIASLVAVFLFILYFSVSQFSRQLRESIWLPHITNAVIIYVGFLLVSLSRFKSLLSEIEWDIGMAALGLAVVAFGWGLFTRGRQQEPKDSSEKSAVPQISDEVKQRVKSIVKFHYGFIPKEADIEWIDRMLRNNYAVLHEQQIIRELAAKNMSNGLLKHRDRIGSTEFERIWLEKDIFRYLTFASMCFRAGVPAGAIGLCRTAIESGLKEKLAEEAARKEITDESKLSEVTLNKLKRLGNKSLHKLIKEATERGIIKGQDIEEAFQELKPKDQSGRKILDKFIHGEITWIVDYVKDRKDIGVIGAKDELDEYKVISEAEITHIATEALKASYRIAEILYFTK